MKLFDAIQGVRRLAFDTSALIYYIERHPTYFSRMHFMMDQIDKGLISGFASTIALTELLVQPLRKGDVALARQYERVLLMGANFSTISIGSITARYAADLRARYNLRTPDALHIASAVEMQCDAFVTNDIALKRITEIDILILDELQL
jgi:predicted nucleic acid-binding protein